MLNKQNIPLKKWTFCKIYCRIILNHNSMYLMQKKPLLLTVFLAVIFGYVSTCQAAIPAVELAPSAVIPIAAHEMAPADLQAVEAHELTAVAAIELPPPQDNPTQQAPLPAPKVAAPVPARPVSIQVADSHEPAPAWTPDSSRRASEYNPSVY
jgi:hypothetical protein